MDTSIKLNDGLKTSIQNYEQGILVNQIIQGNCREVLRSFPPESIDLVMFSPPYWGLRFYGEAANSVWGGDPNCEHEWGDELEWKQRGAAKRFTAQVGNQINEVQGTTMRIGQFCRRCGAWYGQLGLEPDFRMYIEHLVEIGREIKRVLKKTGSWYLNLGDTYAGSGCGYGSPPDPKWRARDGQLKPRKTNVPKRGKILIPYRVVIALQDDGWVVPNDIVWYKPNAMPSSVKRRLSNKFEFVFHLVKDYSTYYYDLDAIREPHSTATIKRISQPTVLEQRGGPKQDALNPKTGTGGNYNRPAEMVKSLAKKIMKHDLAVGRFGRSYPDPLHERDTNPFGKNPGDFWEVTTKPFKEAHFAVYPPALCVRPILSSCPPDGIVLDPMCGSGTTLAVAKALGRRWIGIEINPEYVEIAKRRVGKVTAPLTPITNVKDAMEAVRRI